MNNKKDRLKTKGTVFFFVLYQIFLSLTEL